MQPSKRSWDDFASKMLVHSGLDLRDYKAPQMQRRTLNMMESKSFVDLEEFWNWIFSSKANLQWYLDKLAINVSELFRNPDRWSEVETVVLPDLLGSKRELRAWSAGCSYGAEAYTLAMILRENFDVPFNVTGTDIDEEALAQAEEGVFSDNDVRAVPKKYRRYLTRCEEKWRADEALKRHLKFKRQNLLAEKFETGFDLIVCRNVVIYFTDDARNDLYQRFFDSLRPGGYLFVGGTERIFNNDAIGFETALPFFYKKPTTEATQWRNAS
ncbi:MAG TPA: protein-glutamate O-methyltransferase CheR [Fimbriimonadaceae bacterium]|nr:protein-glutamate O-methyltransferase CheR [Fimbriimonadaceae bacterium]